MPRVFAMTWTPYVRAIRFAPDAKKFAICEEREVLRGSTDDRDLLAVDVRLPRGVDIALVRDDRDNLVLLDEVANRLPGGLRTAAVVLHHQLDLVAEQATVRVRRRDPRVERGDRAGVGGRMRPGERADRPDHDRRRAHRRSSSPSDSGATSSAIRPTRHHRNPLRRPRPRPGRADTAARRPITGNPPSQDRSPPGDCTAPRQTSRGHGTDYRRRSCRSPPPSSAKLRSSTRNVCTPSHSFVDPGSSAIRFVTATGATLVGRDGRILDRGRKCLCRRGNQRTRLHQVGARHLFVRPCGRRVGNGCSPSGGGIGSRSVEERGGLPEVGRHRRAGRRVLRDERRELARAVR